MIYAEKQMSNYKWSKMTPVDHMVYIYLKFKGKVCTLSKVYQFNTVCQNQSICTSRNSRGNLHFLKTH